MENKKKTKEELRNEKRLLEEQLAEVSKPYSFKQKLVYAFIVAATIQGSVSFLSSMPMLQLLVPPLVAMTIPVVYSSIKFRKSLKLEEEIFDIDEKIKDAICEEMDARINKSYRNEKDITYTGEDAKIQDEERNLTEQFLEEMSDIGAYVTTIANSGRFDGYEVPQVRYAYSSPLNYHSYRTERDETKKPGILYRDLEDDDEIQGPTLVKRK